MFASTNALKIEETADRLLASCQRVQCRWKVFAVQIGLARH
jgi:hypothetical protein